MKKSLLITLFLLIVSHTYSQKLCKRVDEFDGKISYRYESYLMEIDNNSNQLIISPFFKEVEGKIEFLQLFIGVKGLECIEKGSEIILIFENGEKITLNNWNDFNCKDMFFCSISPKLEELFKTYKLSKFKITNLRNNKSTAVLEVKDGLFFKNVYTYLESINNDVSKVEICKKK